MEINEITNFFNDVNTKLDVIVSGQNSMQDTVALWIAMVALFVAIAAFICDCISLQNTRKEFKINLREQQRSNDISLFDKRQEILEEIEADHFDFNMDRVELLFDEDISSKIIRHKELIKELANEYKNNSQYKDELYGVQYEGDIKEDLIKAIITFEDGPEKNNENDVMFQAACEFIKNHPLELKDGNKYDFLTITENITKYQKEHDISKQEIVDKIKSFIKKSIEKQI